MRRRLRPPPQAPHLAFVYTFVYICDIPRRVAGFEWDHGNSAKCQKHGLTLAAIESCFARPILVLPDDDHSQTEKRLRAIGRDKGGRYVFIVFTVRPRGHQSVIRPISARYMHTKEIAHYEKENPDF